MAGQRPPLRYLIEPMGTGRYRVSVVVGAATFDTFGEALAHCETTGEDQRRPVQVYLHEPSLERIVELPGPDA